MEPDRDAHQQVGKENLVPSHTMEFYAAMRERETMVFAGKWIQLKAIKLNERSHI